MKMLAEKLETKVKADSLSINPWKGKVTLYGFYLEDKRRFPMLKIDTLHAGVSLMHLIHKEVRLNDVMLHGADITLYKAHSDSAANYQFAIDAFKSKKKKGDEAGEKKKKSGFSIGVDVDDLSIKRLHVKWDVCDKQYKFIGKPNRGHFDANHINAYIDILAKVETVRKDSFDVRIKNSAIHDYASGLDIKNLTAKAGVGKNYFSVPDLTIMLDSSSIKIDKVMAHYEVIPKDTVHKKKAKVNMTFMPFDVKSDIVLKDISKPFGMSLNRFTTPLKLYTRVSGSLEDIIFDDIQISTPDNRLTLTAIGQMRGILLGKEGLNIGFRHINMRARKNVHNEIIMHFAKKVRLKMMDQLRAVGDVGFMGSVDILYKREVFDGVLLTNLGNVNTRFVINDKKHFMSGYLSTTAFALGSVMNVSALGPVNARATFNFNVSKKAKRPATALPNGRLPMGYLRATINDAKYGIVSFQKLEALMESDGSTAFGSILLHQPHIDFVVDFDYIQTDDLRKLKVYPAVMRNSSLDQGMSVIKRRQLRAQKKAEKELEKARREQLREENMRLKERRQKATAQLKKEMKKLKQTLSRFKKKSPSQTAPVKKEQ